MSMWKSSLPQPAVQELAWFGPDIGTMRLPGFNQVTAGMLSRCCVLVLLALVAATDYGHDRQLVHWAAFTGYAALTILQAWMERRQSWANLRRSTMLGVAAADAALASYVLLAHLARSGHEAGHAIDAMSLLPAFLFLLQTGLSLQPYAVAAFSAVLAAAWVLMTSLLITSGTSGAAGGLGAVIRQSVGIAAFVTAAALVFTAVSWANRTMAKAVGQGTRLAKFVPPPLAADLAAGREVAATERHASLIAVDVRGFSALARDYGNEEAVAWLLTFRRLIHDAVTAQDGVVDKYIGDGVLAFFLEGSPRRQAGQALMAIRQITIGLTCWNLERKERGEPELRITVSAHCGAVLAGVFDDGRRAEYTILGPAMNSLTRIERCAKEVDVDIAATRDFIEAVPPAMLARFTRVRALSGSEKRVELPDLMEIRIADA